MCVCVCVRACVRACMGCSVCGTCAEGVDIYMNEYFLCSNCNMAEHFPEKSSWCLNEQVCLEVKCKAL